MESILSFDVLEPTTVATSFAFGYFLGLGWLWWPLLITTVLCEVGWTSRRVNDKEYGLAVGFILLLLVTLHIFGIVDVIGLFIDSWRLVLIWIGVSLAIGIPYAAVRLYFEARNERDEAKSNYKGRVEHWHLTNSDATAEEQANAFHDIAQDIRDIESDKSWIFYLVVFWKFDALWHLVFQWLDRLRDLFNLCWKSIKGIAQKIKNAGLGDFTKDN
jgi:hypothetical protein